MPQRCPGRSAVMARAGSGPGRYRTSIVTERGHAGPQQMRVRMVVLQQDLDGHPLDHLDPVARRVLGGEQAEPGAGPGADRVDTAAEDAVRKRVHPDGHRLPGTDPADLRLLEVRDHPDSLERDDGEERLADLDHLARLDGLLRDHAGGRGHDPRLGQLELRGRQLGLGLLDARSRAARCGLLDRDLGLLGLRVGHQRLGLVDAPLGLLNGQRPPARLRPPRPRCRAPPGPSVAWRRPAWPAPRDGTSGSRRAPAAR